METAANYAELMKTTEDTVKVLCDDGYFGSGQTVVFEKASFPVESAYFRNNGDQMIPRPLTRPMPATAPMDHIWSLFNSYLCREDIHYGNWKTAFNEECTDEIDCSALAQLILWDIPFEKSAYAGCRPNDFGPRFRRNVPKNVCGYAGKPRVYGLRAAEIAQFFAEQGRLFVMGQDRPDWPTRLQPGDVAFEADPTGALSASARRYLHIIHVVIVLKYEPEYDRMWFMQSGGVHAGAEGVLRKADGTAFGCSIGCAHIKDQGDKWPVFARPAWQ